MVTIWSYTVSKFARFLRHSVLTFDTTQLPRDWKNKAAMYCERT